jgi:hypothetical protein
MASDSLSGIHFVGAPTDEIRVRAHQRHEILNSLLTTPRESNQLRTAFVRPEFIFFARISERISRAIELENFAAPQRRLVSPHLLTVFVRRATRRAGPHVGGGKRRDRPPDIRSFPF